MIFKVQRIVLSSVCSQPSWCLGPRFRGALYLRSRRSSNPSSFAFCRTSSSSLQRKLAVSATVRPWASSFLRSLISASDHGSPELASIGSVLSRCISSPCLCIAACIHSLAKVSNLRRSMGDPPGNPGRVIRLTADLPMRHCETAAHETNLDIKGAPSPSCGTPTAGGGIARRLS